MDQTRFTPFDPTPDLNAASSAPDAAPVPPVAAPPRLETFGDVDEYIRDHPDSPVSGRGPWRSSCRRAAWSVNTIRAAERNEPFEPDMKKLDLATVRFDISMINLAWKGRSYRAAGFASKSAFRNARWAIRRIGRVAGTVLPRFAPPILSDDPFQPLLQTANKYDKPITRLFAAWCREAGLCPGDVDDAALRAYQAYVLTHLVGKKADEIIRLLARLWTDTALRDPAWPQAKLSAPSLVTPPSPPFTAYPISLQEDIAAFRAWMAGTRRRRLPHPRPGTKRAMRPASITNMLTCIPLALWALVAGGRDPASIIDLGCLVSEPNMEAILLYHEDRAKAKQQALHEAEWVGSALTQSIAW
jgi:hypothetical protein